MFSLSYFQNQFTYHTFSLLSLPGPKRLDRMGHLVPRVKERFNFAVLTDIPINNTLRFCYF